MPCILSQCGGGVSSRGGGEGERKRGRETRKYMLRINNYFSYLNRKIKINFLCNLIHTHHYNIQEYNFHNLIYL